MLYYFILVISFIFIKEVTLTIKKIITHDNIINGAHVICGSYLFGSELTSKELSDIKKHKLLVVLINLQSPENYNLELVAITGKTNTSEDERLNIKDILQIHSVVKINRVRYFIFDLSKDKIKKISSILREREFLKITPRHARTFIIDHEKFLIEKGLEYYDDISFFLSGYGYFSSKGNLMKGFTRISCKGEVKTNIKVINALGVEMKEMSFTLELNIFATVSVSGDNEFEIMENKSVFKFSLNERKHDGRYALYSENNPNTSFIEMFSKLWDFGERYEEIITKYN